MELILQVFYSVFSALLIAAALPNEIYLLGCPVIILFALIPFYFSISKAKNYLSAFVIGFSLTFSTHLFSSFWLGFFKDFALLTLGFSALGTGFIGAAFGLFLYLPYADSKNRLNLDSLKYKLTNSIIFRILYFAAIYTVYEWVKSCGFLGYPWATLSASIYRWPVLMQLSAITGTYGISFLLALCNAVLAEGINFYFQPDYNSNRNRFFGLKHSARLTLILFVLSLAYGAVEYDKKRSPQKYLTTVMVQQNSDPWKEKDDNVSILRSQELTKKELNNLKNENKKAQLVVWSEGILRYYLPGSYHHYEKYPEEKSLIDFIKDIKTPLLIGGPYLKSSENKTFYNTAAIFDKNGNFRGFYGKNHLVPFAEVLPGYEIPAIRNFMAKVVGISAGWTPGDQYVFFDIPCSYADPYLLPPVKSIDISIPYDKQKQEENKTPTVKIAAPICFDDAFPDVIRPLYLNGAELFVNLTDDSWSLKKSSEYQHFVVASYRAIECRQSFVRSTNAGYSVVLSPTGRVLKDLPLFEECSTSFEVPVYNRTITTYMRFGNWVPYTFILLAAAYFVYMYYTFSENDYIPSARKISKKGKKKKHHKK